MISKIHKSRKQVENTYLFNYSLGFQLKTREKQANFRGFQAEQRESSEEDQINRQNKAGADTTSATEEAEEEKCGITLGKAEKWFKAMNTERN